MRRLLDWRESLPSACIPDLEPDPEPLPVERVREVLHPVADREAWREAAIAWGRRSPDLESCMGSGAVVPFGWIRHSEAQRIHRLGDDDRREAARRLMEEERICWCEDDLRFLPVKSARNESAFS